MRYAKGRYARRKNPVISYADIKFNFKKVQYRYRAPPLVMPLKGFQNFAFIHFSMLLHEKKSHDLTKTEKLQQVHWKCVQTSSIDS